MLRYKKEDPAQGREKSIVGLIDIYSLLFVLYFLFIECTGVFTFLNEYRIWPCLYFFLVQFDIPYSNLFVQVTLSHFSKFKIIVGMSLPCLC